MCTDRLLLISNSQRLERMEGLQNHTKPIIKLQDSKECFLHVNLSMKVVFLLFTQHILANSKSGRERVIIVDRYFLMPVSIFSIDENIGLKWCPLSTFSHICNYMQLKELMIMIIYDR